MPSSYPNSGGAVNAPAPRAATSAASPSRTSRPPAKPAARKVATFTPYFWEAYNQIVQPHRWDWYLISKWLPDLGHEGFTVVKVLRSECYFNPKGGELRDVCRMDVEELAKKCGMGRSTLYKVLNREAVKAFVQRMPDAVYVEGKTRRLPPEFRVCMDTPVHPDDMEEYDRLRGRNEIQRAVDEEEERKSKIEIYAQRKSKIDERKSTNEGRKSTTEISYNRNTSLPPVSILDPIHGDAVPDTPADGRPEPPINPPKGEKKRTPSAAESEAQPSAPLDPLAATWNVALGHLAESDTITKPTMETHLKRLRLVSISTAGDITLAAPNEFSRGWVAGRHQEGVEAALAQALGHAPASVQIIVEAK